MGTLRSLNQRITLRLGVPGARTLRQARLADMAALEQLPGSVRALLCELTVNLSAVTVLGYLRSIERQARECGGSPYEAEVWTCRKLAALEADELDAFDRAYREAWRLPLPHAAAGVTVLRYGAVTH